MRITDFDFNLPDDLIAREPTPERSASRLLVPRDTQPHQNRRFADLPQLLAPGDLIVFNDSRVLRARLRGHKQTGGAVEALVERVTDTHAALAQMRMSKPAQPGSTIDWQRAQAKVIGRTGEFWQLTFNRPVFEVLEDEGEMPLPPYLNRAPGQDDDTRYQTVYARHPGSVAAPTAGLHFDDALLKSLAARGIERAFVTLHVGAGTFQPVRVDDIRAHRMHSEHYEISAATAAAIRAARARGGRVVAVGTTSLRTLESAAIGVSGEVRSGPGDTALFITPGYRFQVVDALITNFHLPRSTLLMLVSAFAGIDLIRAAYAHAIADRYRFFSYGDAMLLERSPAHDHIPSQHA
jgi:S-adenosylmethionine:tRNA ribosyltransferase-isomerase